MTFNVEVNGPPWTNLTILTINISDIALKQNVGVKHSGAFTGLALL